MDQTRNGVLIEDFSLRQVGCCAWQLFQLCFIFQGQVSDIAIHAQEILRLRTSLNEIYASHTGQPVDIIGDILNPSPLSDPPSHGHNLALLRKALLTALPVTLNLKV